MDLNSRFSWNTVHTATRLSVDSIGSASALHRLRMITPIRCFTCGYPIGRVAVVFRSIRARLVKEFLKAHPLVATQAAIDATLQLDMSGHFARLAVTNDCCKVHLGCAMDLRDYI